MYDFYARCRNLLIKLTSKSKDHPQPRYLKLENLVSYEDHAEIVFDLRRNLYDSWVPSTLLHAIRYAKVAQHRHLTFIPQYLSLEKVKAEVILKISSNPVKLRDVLCDSDLV